MPDQENRTLEEELAEKGIVASYIWKPNRVFVKDNSEYVPVDVVSDGDAQDIQQAIEAAGDQQLASIAEEGQNQLANLTASEEYYTDIKNNLIQTYTRMRDYFDRHGIVSLSTMMSTAIARLNAL